MEESDRMMVDEQSAIWNQIRYRIQLATGKPSIKLLNLYQYPSQMEKSIKDTSIPAIIDATDLKSTFTTMVIGRQIPLEDLILICGHINLEKYHQNISKVFHFLICEVNVGHIGHFTSGFQYSDSLLIQQNQEGDPFHYNLFVKSYNQYTVKFQCSFVIGEGQELKVAVPRCSNCGIKLGTVYCKNQRKHFCKGCSGKIHTPPPLETQKKLKQVPQPHQLQQTNRTNVLPLCESHGLRHQFYCLKCEEYKCQSCMQQPSHNQKQEHPTRPIQYVYAEMRQSTARLPLKPKEKLNKLRKMCQQKQKGINQNYKQVKKQLIVEFERAMAELQHLYRERIRQVTSDLIQIEMEIDRLQWNFSFLKAQEEELKPINYFHLQRRLQAETQALSINHFNNSARVKSNLDQVSIIKVGYQEQIEEFMNSNLSAKDAIRKQKIMSHKQYRQQMSKSSERVLLHDPNSEPPQRGKLSLLLQSSGLQYFKFQHINK